MACGMSLSVMTMSTRETENALDAAPISHLLESANRITRRAIRTRLRLVRAISSFTSTTSKAASIAWALRKA